MKTFTITSCMAPNMDFLCQDLADYLTSQLGFQVRPVLEPAWQERERLFDAGEINLCWICGLPYIRKADQASGRVTPLIAPVMAGERYQNLPIYFSDAVVHRDSPYRRFADLRGASWAINEPNSHSGYGVVRYALAAQNETLDFFGRVVESGAHQNSLAMILQKEVDGSAIDSTVLELELANHPEIEPQIRIIETFGPSPIPPWVIPGETPAELRQALRDVFTRMDHDAQGRTILAKAKMSRFVPVSDADYDPIRTMTRLGFS